MLERRLRRFMTGKDGSSLEHTIVDLINKSDNLDTQIEEVKSFLKNVNERLSRSVQRVKLVKFDAFKDTGGSQSFAAALLDEKGDGILLSTMCAREKIYLYAKPITNYRSNHELTKEEREAIRRVIEGGES